MSQDSKFIARVVDNLRCSVCFEVFKEPQCLKCLHTFCETCISKMLERNQITCPTCRKITREDDITFDFKTKHLVELYQQDNSALSVPLDKASLVKHEICRSIDKCDLCELNLMEYFCKNCCRYVCKFCRKSHPKDTACQEKHNVKLEVEISKINKTLDEKMNAARAESTRIKVMQITTVKDTNAMCERTMKELEKEEEKTLSEVRQWYKEQREVVRRKTLEANESTTKQCEEFIKTGQLITQTILQAKVLSTKVLFATHESVHSKVDQVLEKLRYASTSPLHLTLIPREIQPCETITVVGFKEVCLAAGSFAGTLKSLKSIKVQKVRRLQGQVSQLLLVQGQLWALMRDHIKVLGPDGAVTRTLTPSLKNALDMCMVGDHVIVADNVAGLLHLSSGGHLIRHLDTGKYLSVTSCVSKWTIWAVKREAGISSGLCLCNFDVISGECVAKVKTRVTTGGFLVYCCVLSGSALYLCRQKDGCVYIVDSGSGNTLAIVGRAANSDVGKLDVPWHIYGDEICNSLLIVDRGNCCLQIYDVTSEKWTRVLTTGDQLPQITSAVLDGRGHLWVAGDTDLYRCTPGSRVWSSIRKALPPF